MKTIHVFKAQPIVRSEPIESVTLIIDKEIPDVRDLAAAQANQFVFEEDARALAEALRCTLPGGTLDALTVELLRGKATSLVVPRDAR